jgi:hypothetical protein
MAKIEYRDCKEMIDSMLAQDFSPKLIHEKLTAEGRFTMAYPSFTQILRNAERTIPSSKPTPVAPPASPPLQSANSIKTPKTSAAPVVQKKLTRPEDIDRNSLF